MKFRALERVPFRKSEKTRWFDFIAEHPRFKLGDDEVLVFVSQSYETMDWLYGVLELEDGSLVLRSRRLRLLKGEWNILRLKDYAKRVGLKVEDWSVFEGALAKLRKQLLKAKKTEANLKLAA